MPGFEDFHADDRTAFEVELDHDSINDRSLCWDGDEDLDEEPEDDLEDEEFDGERDQFNSDADADADVLKSAGMGTDEDYGHFDNDIFSDYDTPW